MGDKHHSKKVAGPIPPVAFVCGVGMFSLCLHGVPTGPYLKDFSHTGNSHMATWQL